MVTSTFDCPTVYSDRVTTEPTNSKNFVNQQTTSIHLIGMAMPPISIQVKITSILQKSICATRMALVMKMTARQNQVMIEIPDMLQSLRPTEVNILSTNDDTFQDEILSLGGKWNLRPSPKSNLSDSYRYWTGIK